MVTTVYIIHYYDNFAGDKCVERWRRNGEKDGGWEREVREGEITMGTGEEEEERKEGEKEDKKDEEKE